MYKISLHKYLKFNILYKNKNARILLKPNNLGDIKLTSDHFGFTNKEEVHMKIGIDDYKREINNMVNEIGNFSYIIKIFSYVKLFYNLFRRGE